MIEARQLLVTMFGSIFILAACNKDNIRCTKETEFCKFITAEEFKQTGPLINSFVKRLEFNLSDQEKLEKLNEWLKCKKCVSNAIVLCNSCIQTGIAQSELKIWFNVKGQQIEKILDISMSEPLQFRTYHD